MALGRKNDDEVADDSGHYTVDLMRIYTPAKLAAKMNERWEQGWRLVPPVVELAGSVTLTFERRT